MKISTLWYSIKQGCKNIKRNRLFSLASIGTIVACLFLFGVFLSIVLNFRYMVKQAESSVGISVFFDEGIESTKIDSIGEQIRKRAEVKEIKFISAEEAWENFKKESFKEEEDQEILEGFEDDNPLADSASYEITLNDISMQKSLVKYIEGLDGVREVKHSEDVANSLSTLQVLVGYASIAVIAILLGVSLFLISNTIHMGIAVRKEEIAIMKLIGATDFFVRAPFIVEGVLIGFIGSIIPIGLLYFMYDTIVSYVLENFSVLSNILTFLPPNEVAKILIPVSIIIGVGVGFVGSYTTARKHLKV